MRPISHVTNRAAPDLSSYIEVLEKRDYGKIPAIPVNLPITRLRTSLGATKRPLGSVVKESKRRQDRSGIWKLGPTPNNPQQERRGEAAFRVAEDQVFIVNFDGRSNHSVDHAKGWRLVGLSVTRGSEPAAKD